MSKSNDTDVPDPLLDLLAGDRQKVFDFVDEANGGVTVKYIGESVDGFGLFKRLEAHGGYSYWSTEIPPAVFVYDEGTSNLFTLFGALEDLGKGEEMWRQIGHTFGYTFK